jgi:hypothetical protein
LPNAEARQKHIDQIGRAIVPGAHALIIFDKTGWHTLLSLPPAVRSSTPPKTSGNICARPISPTACSTAAILDACQDTRRKLLDEADRIGSLAACERSTFGHSILKAGIIHQTT